MEYSECFRKMKAMTSPELRPIAIPGSEVTIVNLSFVSEEPLSDFMNANDSGIKENSTFTYPVFIPPMKDSNRVIILLHGLNERSWQKYLPWAFFLAGQTGSYVILFPISFHINRSPSSWKDPRVMGSILEKKDPERLNVIQSSFANVALSSRLTEDPMRFFYSGYRTATDICRLVGTIKEGKHELIPKPSGMNIFSYSIGSFLSQILMLANPGGLLTESKLFMLCGGSVFSRMKGTSKLIMDNIAFNRLYDFYLNEFEVSLNRKNPLFEFLNESILGLTFRSMIDISRLRSFREKLMKNIRDQVSAVSFRKDKVIPASGISETIDFFTSGRKLEVIDPAYEYSHENPFPVFSNELSHKVDDCFKRVMGKAAEFLI